MCWVMPPASPAATSVSRIASSSEVLPWSTCPMIVTTGGRPAPWPPAAPRARRALDQLLLGVLVLGLDDRLVLGMDDLHFLAELGGQHLDRLVRQCLGQRL